MRALASANISVGSSRCVHLTMKPLTKSTSSFFFPSCIHCSLFTAERSMEGLHSCDYVDLHPIFDLTLYKLTYNSNERVCTMRTKSE